MFKTDIVNLEMLEKYDFSIPTYQRPYVWGDEQIKKILDDFYQSFSTSPENVYYVSSFLTKEEESVAELIDGQQRFTTLWLIAFVINNLSQDSSLTSFLKKEGNLRLSFEIRKEVEEFLISLLEEESQNKKLQDEQYINEQPYLRNIARALVFIDGYIKQLALSPCELKDFGDFIYRKVHLIKNTTPKNTDLNKLFSTINNSGIQLEQTDIVKANLLSLIDEKVQYGKIWDTCENMDNFFERNARDSFPVSSWNKINLEEFIPFNGETFKYTAENQKSEVENNLFSIDILDIENIAPYKVPEKNFLNEKGRESEEIYCRSIINFSQLLIHTYRLHLHLEGKDDFKGTFHVSRLIEIFSELEKGNDPEEIKRFFRLLWNVRYLFDKYIVKWISDLDTKAETLELVNFNRTDKSYYSRSKYEKSGSLMLQSVLYFTGDYLRQYWLTSYLGYLLKNHENLAPNDASHLSYLESMDNQFSLNKSESDKKLSWLLLNQEFTAKQDVDIEEYLSLCLGTGFKHYWFQKLEYILWKNWEFEKTEEFKKYRITSKNSIEHIYPQNPENRIQHPELKGEILHSFGNLVLLSVAQNSEYSNKSVNVKKSMFNEKKDTYDTLKSYYIFQNDNWSTNEVEEHKDLMLFKILKHYA